MADFASNCPISRPIKLNGVDLTQDFNGIGFSPQVGWMFNADDELEPIEGPTPGATG